MRKSFRNRLLAVAAVGVSSFLLLTGFDSSLTVEDVVNNARENASFDQACMKITGAADISLDVSAGDQTQSMPLSGGFDLDADYIMSPFQMHVSGNMKGDASVLGMSADLGVDVYLEAEDDGTGMMYAKVSGIDGAEETWHAGRLPAEYMSQMLSALEASRSGEMPEALGNIDLQGAIDAFNSSCTLSPNPVDVDGIECYEITGSLDGATLSSVVTDVLKNQSVAQVDETTAQMVGMVLSGLKVDMTADYATDNFKSVYGKLDLAASDFSMIAQIAGAFMGGGDESGASIDLTVSALNMEYTSDFESPVSIEIPAEALTAEVEDISPAALGSAAGEAEESVAS